MMMHESDALVVTRDVTPAECPWLDDTVVEGARVYRYHGPMYGCVGSGVAVSWTFNETPAFELPARALAERMTGRAVRGECRQVVRPWPEEE